MEEEQEALAAARGALARRQWALARAQFEKALSAGPLPADDVHGLGEADWWLGMISDALAAYEQAYRDHLAQNRPDRAAMSALDLAGTLFVRGDHAEGSAWLSRFRRLLADLPDGPEHGYARHLELQARAAEATPEDLIEGAQEVQAIGRRYGDDCLFGLGLTSEGRALISSGRVTDGMALLDEAMLVAVSAQIDPAFAGNIYCEVIAACHELGDVPRMREWTDALDRWCRQLSAAVLFTGICRVHRSQLHLLQGTWETAEREAIRVCADLEGIQLSSVAEAQYTIGELRLLRGDLAAAEYHLQLAERGGRDPEPAMARLRLAQGRPDRAAAMIKVALAAAGRPLARSPLLAAAVEIALATGEVDAARAAADELDAIADRYASPWLRAAASQSIGTVLLAEGRWAEALSRLRVARRRWQDLDAPYDTAKVQVLIARSYREQADLDSAARALAAAEETFRRLGATPDVRRVEQLRAATSLPDGLTAREAEVLALVATGRTNREIADALVISQKTVARHLSNIFAKCGLASRTAAAGYAFEHHLVAPGMGRSTHRSPD
jgi:DNA-binding CsgD family transcriptional regulator